MALTGFWMQGVCYATQAEVVSALQSISPVISGQFLTTVNAVASGASSVSVATNTMDLSQAANVFISHSGILPLRPCDPLTSPVTLSNIFSLPAATPDVATVWMLGFSLPVICYLAAWGFGIVVNMFWHRDDQ